MLNFVSDCLSTAVIVLGGITLVLYATCPLLGDTFILFGVMKYVFDSYCFAALSEGGFSISFRSSTCCTRRNHLRFAHEHLIAETEVDVVEIAGSDINKLF